MSDPKKTPQTEKALSESDLPPEQDTEARDPDGAEMDKDTPSEPLVLMEDDKDPDATPEIEDAQLVDEDVTSAEDIEAALDGADAPEPDPAPQTEPAPVQQVVEKRGGFGSAFLGGVVAAGLGFGLCYYLVQQGTLSAGPQETFDAERAQIASLSDTVGGLENSVAEMTATLGAEDPRMAELGAALSGLRADFDGVQTSLGTLQAEIEGQSGLVAGMRSELDAIAQMPAAETGGDPAAVAALQARLQEQQAANAQTQSELQAMAEQARAEMEEVRSRAGALQAETQAAVDEASNRAAIANLTSALESGTPLAPALAGLSGDVPDALAAVADSGVETVLDLQRAFPAAARAGLAESLKVTVGDAPRDRVFAFLKAQVGARSLEGREGDDPDAILARAQEAVSGAQFDAALNEIAALPEVGQAAMSDWVGLARARVEAIAARDSLAAEMISN